MYVTDLIIAIMMILNFLAGAFYFATRDNETWADIPILSSLFSTAMALLIATAAIGEFIKSSTDTSIVYLGFGLVYILVMLVMGVYWLYSTADFLYNKLVAKVL